MFLVVSRYRLDSHPLFDAIYSIFSHRIKIAMSDLFINHETMIMDGPHKFLTNNIVVRSIPNNNDNHL